MIYDVTAYGAIADGSTDCAPAIQQAITEATLAHGIVEFPAAANPYVVKSPIQIKQSGLRMRGAVSSLGGGTTIESRGYTGPVIHLLPAASTQDLTFAPSLLTGPGQALALNPATAYTDTYLDLQESASMRLGGLGAVTIEFTLLFTSVGGSYYTTLLSSSGRYTQSDPLHTTYSIYASQDLRIHAQLNVAGILVSLYTAANTLVSGSVYAVALTYDGTTVRLFYGTPGTTMVLAASAPARGAIQQTEPETQTIGGVHAPWPFGGVFGAPPLGAIDGIRISNTCRYTAPYTAATSKPTFDSHTLLLENFDNETNDFSIVQTSLGPTYLCKLKAFAGIFGDIEIDHLNLYASYGTGIFSQGVIHHYLHDMTLWGGVFGYNGWNNNYLSRMERITALGNGPWSKVAILNGGSSGVFSMKDLDLTSWTAPITIDTASGTAQGIYIHGDCEVQILARLCSYNFQELALSNEDATARFRTNILLDHVYSMQMALAGCERFVNQGPAIQVDGGDAISFTNLVAEMAPGTVEVINLLSPTNQKMVLINPSYGIHHATGIPWCSTPGAVVTLP